MKSKVVSGIMLILLLASIFALRFDVRSVSAPDLSIEGILLPYIPCIIGPPQCVLYPDHKPVGFEGYYIYANVTNQGTADAGSFNVSFSAYWEEEEVPEVLQKKTLAGLEQGATKTKLRFEFMPENYGSYTLLIIADCDDNVAELDETNNRKTAGAIGTVGGDVDGDGDVDWVDFGDMATYYGIKFEEPPYHPADIDYDGDVDWEDFGTFATNYGMHV